jgi:TRAP-type mannitol/chloroaromatic compound transport system permease small subunit
MSLRGQSPWQSHGFRCFARDKVSSLHSSHDKLLNVFALIYLKGSIEEYLMLSSVIKAIDSISTWSGKLVAWLIIPNVIALVYEVIARYILESPTIWSYEVTYFLYGTHFLLGAAYTLSIKAHIRIDVLHMHLPQRAKAIVDVLGYLLIFFPVMIVLIYAGTEFTIQSWEMGEKSGLSPWRPPLFPYKAVLVVSFFFLFLQGIAEFLRNLIILSKGKE